MNLLILTVSLFILGNTKIQKTQTTKRPFQIKITNAQEVRMGSPYNICELEIVGFNKKRIPKNGWQDKFAWTNDSKKLALIKWDFEKNDPGFHVYLIDMQNGTSQESPKLNGLPDKISVEGSKVTISKFLYDKSKSKPRNLCCHVTETYKF